MTETPRSNDADEALVAEYVVGVLPAEERRALHDRMSRDPVIRQRISAWEARMEALNATYGQLAAPRAVKASIDRRLFGKAERPKPRFASIAGTLAGLVSVAVAVAFLAWGPQNGDLSATLAGDNGAPFATILTGKDTLQIIETATLPPAGSVFELWAVRSDQPPQSLGTFSAAGHLQLAAALGDGATLAVSIEPPGGSPSGAPTGPVIATGILKDG